MSDHVQCPWCQGTGQKALSPAYAEALELLRRQPTPLNGAALASLVGVEPTAMNSRLIALEQMGLAEGEWNGRERTWKTRREAS